MAPKEEEKKEEQPKQEKSPEMQLSDEGIKGTTLY
jgi:hypothetical protein